MTQDRPDDNQDQTIEEPANSTVDDWFGQNVARDQDVADEVAEDADSEQEAEAEFERRADGEKRFQEGHDRPEDAEADGPEVGRPS